ncbi:hypothetical protein IQ07DRAFT_596060 [Pyrenochaeta sp. DS3sAY3a]|nr:hypothetical protein IQ07DRAFT_596060 [Pyrenochaeta sp. DS3sAY3a]
MARLSLSLKPAASNKKHKQTLFSLSKDVHSRLPREVRDMIYAYLLTPHEIFRISRCSSIRLDRFPHARVPQHHPQHAAPDSKKKEKGKKAAEALYRPPFIDPTFTYPPFAAEVIQLHHELYKDFWVDTPSALPSFLATDFFSLNCTPGHARLSALHISGQLDLHTPTSIDLTTLAADLAALLATPWAPTFDLNIAFHSELAVSYWSGSAIPELARTMHGAWSVLAPWIAQAEQRGARVYFILLTKATLHKYMCGEHDMLGSEEEWTRMLQGALGHLCYSPRGARDMVESGRRTAVRAGRVGRGRGLRRGVGRGVERVKDRVYGFGIALDEMMFGCLKLCAK